MFGSARLAFGTILENLRRKTKESGTETQTSGSVSSNSRGISTQLKKNRKIGVEATVNSNLSFLIAEIFVFLNYSKIVLLRQENIRIMLAVLLLEKGQKLCSIPQIMPKIMLAQSARAYSRCIFSAFSLAESHPHDPSI